MEQRWEDGGTEKQLLKYSSVLGFHTDLPALAGHKIWETEKLECTYEEMRLNEIEFTTTFENLEYINAVGISYYLLYKIFYHICELL